MLKNFLLLFLALRAADILNLIGGMWLVPKYVAPEDLGGILPLTSFATVLSIPLFAIAMTALRESAQLRAQNLPVRPFVRGIFAAVGVTAALALAGSAAVLPRTLERLRISDSLSGSLAVVAAFLGCVSPVYLDQLQAAKRFNTVGTIEVSAAALRLTVMAILMPVRALAGYFAGGVAKTLVQIFGPLVALIHDASSARSGDRSPGCRADEDTECAIRPSAYWTHDNLLRLAKTFALLLPYLALPMMVSMTENELVRMRTPSVDSAGYYMATRISDLMNYITFPILFVMFPYVTDKASRGESYLKIVLRSCGVVLIVALLAMCVTASLGREILALLPHGENYADYAVNLPPLVLFMALGAVQNLITNAFVAAGQFKFLFWFVPLNLIYLVALPLFAGENPSLGFLISTYTVFALARFIPALVQLGFSSPRVSGNWRSGSAGTDTAADRPH